MKRFLLITLLIASWSCIFANSASVELPSFSLTNISFNVNISNLPDSLESTIIFVKSEDITIEKKIDLKQGKGSVEIALENSGDYFITVAGTSVKSEIRIIPGWLSIVPPLLAILLALIIRQVIVALIAGIYAGAFFIYGYDPFIAFLRLADHFVIDSVTDKGHMFIILFTLLIGGVVGVISKNGGTNGLAMQITKFAKTAKSGMVSSWLMGVLIFFDDYANSLIIGNMMRPITDKLKISREKLAYIIDSTAAPVASIVLISTWIGYEVGLISDGLKSIGSTENGYDVFLSSVSYSFYPIAAIVFVFLVSYLERDFGPMLKAEKRARATGRVSWDDVKVEGLKDESDLFFSKKPRWINGLIPILVILLGTLISLAVTGINSLKESGITEYTIQDIINNADSYSSLLWSSLLASVVAIIMSISQRILTLKEAVEAWEEGIRSMMIAVLILVFAWSISTVTRDLHTADYLISILSDTLNPKFLPVLIFVLCAIIGFSTGTSWGTMAIVMPIVIPLAHKVSVNTGLPPVEAQYILYAVISSVLAGSVWGDHCSPIADTTILSSLASKCNHIDHVNTQLPYALLVGGVCMVVGYLPAGFGLSPVISLGLVILVLIGVLLFIGKKNTI